MRLALVMTVTTLLGGCAASAQSAPTPNVPKTLTRDTYAQVETLVGLRPGELRFQEVDWKASLYEGLVESQRLDRPLLLWLYFGGPRGAC